MSFTTQQPSTSSFSVTVQQQGVVDNDNNINNPDNINNHGDVTALESYPPDPHQYSSEATTTKILVSEDANGDEQLTVFFYLGIAILSSWVLLIIILVRHYWWNWLLGICCSRYRREESGNNEDEMDGHHHHHHSLNSRQQSIKNRADPSSTSASLPQMLADNSHKPRGGSIKSNHQHNRQRPNHSQQATPYNRQDSKQLIQQI